MSKLQRKLARRLAELETKRCPPTASAVLPEDVKDPTEPLAEGQSLRFQTPEPVYLETVVVAVSVSKDLVIAEVPATGELIRLVDLPARSSPWDPPVIGLLDKIVITATVEVTHPKKQLIFKRLATTYYVHSAGLTPHRGLFYKPAESIKADNGFSHLFGLSRILAVDEVTKDQGYYVGWFYNLPTRWGLKMTGKRLVVVPDDAGMEQRMLVCGTEKLDEKQVMDLLNSLPSAVDRAIYLVRDPDIRKSQLKAKGSSQRARANPVTQGVAIGTTAEGEDSQRPRSSRLIALSKVPETAPAPYVAIPVEQLGHALFDTMPPGQKDKYSIVHRCVRRLYDTKMSDIHRQFRHFESIYHDLGQVLSNVYYFAYGFRFYTLQRSKH